VRYCHSRKNIQNNRYLSIIGKQIIPPNPTILEVGGTLSHSNRFMSSMFFKMPQVEVLRDGIGGAELEFVEWRGSK